MKGFSTVASIALTAAALLAGCQQYQNYPPVATSRGLGEDPNNPATRDAIVASLQYVASRYPPGGPRMEAKPFSESGKLAADYPFAVDVPKGMRKSSYESICKQVGPEVQPLTPEVVEQNKLPVYHVTRVWLRFNQGTVDVLRPMPELGIGPDGSPVYQKITLKLEGGFEPWRVVHGRAYEPGADAQPELYFLPDVERVNQFKYSYMTKDEQAIADIAQNDKVVPRVNGQKKTTEAAVEHSN